MPLLLYRIGSFLAYVAGLFEASVNEMSRARGPDARTGDSKSPGRRIESVKAEYLILKAFSYLFFISFYRAALFFISSLVSATSSFASVMIVFFLYPEVLT